LVMPLNCLTYLETSSSSYPDAILQISKIG
jgi:hypothetical protein